MALSKQHAFLIAPALTAEFSAIVAVSYAALMIAELDPGFRPAYAQNLGAWLAFIAFWQ
jgi:hypothetical protein